ncbi:MAG: pre-mRNA-splicing factor rse1 [Watsoniomyces obsoletus]|nr:MAG: pre-mRNA-splicing factor rse1 [Watsoniomyces obsoletus]
MADGRSERHQRSKSHLTVSLLHRDKGKDETGKLEAPSRLSADTGRSTESLTSTNNGSMVQSIHHGRRPSRFTESLASPVMEHHSRNQSTQSVSTRPASMFGSTAALQPPENAASSLEQSLRTFRVFEMLRNRDLSAISSALKGRPESHSEEPDAQGNAPEGSSTHVDLGALNGTTILHLAVQCADLSTIDYILSQAAADTSIVLDINARDKDGNTALHLAAGLGRTQIVRTLLNQKGINDSLTNFQGQTAVDLARNAEIAQQLQLARSLFVDSVIEQLRKHVAGREYDNFEKLLLDAHVQAVLDLNAPELAADPVVVQTGGTLLHEAARKRDMRLIEILLLNGADPFCCDRRGKLPQDVTKDDRTRAMLKKSPAAAAAQRGIQEKAILRSGPYRNPTSSPNNGSNEHPTVGKEAREMKGYLKKWTNYTTGYKLRWFVLEDGVLSYYKHQDDAGSACRGAINMRIAKINMDPHDNQRFEVQGKSSVKYHLKASHVVEAKRWFWALNNAVQWAKDEAKEVERKKARDQEIFQNKKTEQVEQRASTDPDALAKSTRTSIHDWGVDHDSVDRQSQHLGQPSGPSRQHLMAGGSQLGPESVVDDDEIVSPTSRAPSLAEDLVRVRSRMDASVVDDHDEEEFVDDGSFQHVRPVSKDALDVTAHSIHLQFELLSLVATALQAERAKTPELSISDPTVMQAMASYETAMRSLRSLVGDILKISRDRDAYWQYRLGREQDMRRLWEESMTSLAKEQLALEGKIGESEEKRRRTKQALREVLESTHASELDPLSTSREGPTTGKDPSGDVPSTRPRTASNPLQRINSKLDKQTLMECAYDSESGDDDEFFDATDAGSAAVASTSALARSASVPPEKEDHDEAEGDQPKHMNSKMKELESSFRGYEEPPRQRLKLDADDRPKISLWGVLKSMIGKDMTRMTLPVSFNEPTSLLQRVAEDMEYTDLLDFAASRPDSHERMVYVAGFAASEYASTIGRVAKPFNPLLGETFEYARPDKGYRFFVEQVSHHPPIGAVWSESAQWDYYGESAVRSKFYGKSFEFSHLGTWFLKLRPTSGGEELYSWKKVNASVVGIITNNPTVDNYGPMEIRNWTTGEVAHLDFRQRGWRAAGAYEVKGKVADAKGNTQWSIGGHWNDKIFARFTPGRDDATALSEGSTSATKTFGPGTSPTVIVWKANPRPQGIPFNLTPFVITLNALPDGLKPYLPRTDTRLRPDQRAMEDGEYDLAATEKNRVEEKQRAKRRERELDGEDFVPKWFRKARCPVTGEEFWQSDGSYWNMRRNVVEGGEWEGPEDIF